MKIAVIFRPSNSVGSSNEALNIVRHNPDVFIPVSNTSIGGKPGLQKVDTRFGSPMYYPVASLKHGLKALDASIGLDGILICTVGGDLYSTLPWMVGRWPVVWRFNVNPLEHTFDPGLVDVVPQVLQTLTIVDAIVPCSPFVEENLRALGAENVTTIPTCLDTKECHLANPTEDLVVSLTRISPVKNLLYAVLSMSRVVNDIPTATYRIYGSGDLAGAVANWVMRLNEPRITYEGFMPAEMVLPRAKVFLQTSISENFSLSVLEAMAHGIPVVASKIPGHAVGTVYFDSIKEIVDDVKILLTDDEVWRVRREDGLERVKIYDVREVVPQWVELFEKMQKLKELKRGIF
jgi:glycosyltransferase involved in cell wall biosynthesis